MHVPLEGKVEWQMPHGPELYWRGRLMDIEYEFAAH